MIWILLTLLMAIAAFFAASPFLLERSSGGSKDLRAEVYRRQIAEVDSDEASGAISGDEALALRTEAQRRLISASDERPTMEETMGRPKTIAAMAIAGLVVVSGAALYIAKGSPLTPSAIKRTPLAALSPASSYSAPAAGSMDSVIEGLKARLAKDSSNADGWRMLGWSYFNLNQPQEAADAYARAVELEPDNASYQSAYGEALVMAASGFVTPKAIEVFDRALKNDPGDARARFFKGLVHDQAGDPDAAVSAWIEMVDTAPADAEWVGDLRRRIAARAAEAGIDIAGRMQVAEQPLTSALATPAPTPDQINAAMALPADDRQAMIEGMVQKLAARLEQSPDDPDGWIRLIRSRMVLGRPAEAQDDLARALAVFATKPEIRQRIMAEAAALGVNAQ
jgi:cytochrome c-type biogenesis protein CcmH